MHACSLSQKMLEAINEPKTRTYVSWDILPQKSKILFYIDNGLGIKKDDKLASVPQKKVMITIFKYRYYYIK